MIFQILIWVIVLISGVMAVVQPITFHSTLTNSSEDRWLQRTLDRGEIHRIWIAGLPGALYTGLCWLYVTLVYIRITRNTALAKKSEFTERQPKIAQEIFRNRFVWVDFLVLSLLPFFIVSMIVLYPSIHMPLLIWLWGAWFSFVLWMIIFSLPNMPSLVNVSRYIPSKRLGSSLALVGVFGFLFPTLTACIGLLSIDEYISIDSVTKSMQKIYGLKGLVWEGPKNTFDLLQEKPFEAFYVISGVFVYSSIIASLSSFFLKNTTDNDRLQAVSGHLIFGNATEALKILDECELETQSCVASRIIAILILGDIQRALNMVNRKLQLNQGYTPSINRDSYLYTLITALQWRAPFSTILKLIEIYIGKEPSEEELIVIVVLTRDYAPSVLLDVSDQIFQFALKKSLTRFILLLGTLLNKQSYLVGLPKNHFQQGKSSKAVQLYMIVNGWALKPTDELAETLRNEFPHCTECINCLTSLFLATTVIVICCTQRRVLGISIEQVEFVKSKYAEIAESLPGGQGMTKPTIKHIEGLLRISQIDVGK